MKTGSKTGSRSTACPRHSTGAGDSSTLGTASSSIGRWPLRQMSQLLHCGLSCQRPGMTLALDTISIASAATMARAACQRDLGRDITCR